MKNTLPYLALIGLAVAGLAWTLQVRTTDNRVVASAQWLPAPTDATLTNVEVTRDVCLAAEILPPGQCAIYTNGAVVSLPVPQVPNPAYIAYYRTLEVVWSLGLAAPFDLNAVSDALDAQMKAPDADVTAWTIQRANWNEGLAYFGKNYDWTIAPNPTVPAP